MLSIITFLLFITSISCFPFSHLLRSCLQPIEHTTLDIAQGLKPDLSSTQEFGYVYRIDTPTVRLSPDMSLNDISETTQEEEELESTAAAAMILSSLVYHELDTRLMIKGKMSQLNVHRLKRVQDLEGMLMTIQFETFGNSQQGMWYKTLKSSKKGITGRIQNLYINEEEEELMLELKPEVNHHQLSEYIEYKTGPKSSSKRINWIENKCRMYNGNKRDLFHEVVDSAVLL
ncbi:hypothetical protein BD770DRAFT_441073 [Pilaira anomala]|nr:hypothetical protein BD770DRAFT_441073 [Pilaira anomala]